MKTWNGKLNDIERRVSEEETREEQEIEEGEEDTGHHTEQENRQQESISSCSRCFSFSRIEGRNDLNRENEGNWKELLVSSLSSRRTCPGSCLESH